LKRKIVNTVKKALKSLYRAIIKRKAMEREFCIFCEAPLDNSDEHIIPQSINGTLHSRDLICHECNSKFFGQKIDPVIKQLLNPLLLMLGWENANSIKAEDIRGNEYIIGKGIEIKPIRPEKDIKVQGSQTRIRITGDVKNTLRMFEKESNKLKDTGKVLVKANIKEVKDSSPFIRAKWEIKSSIELVLLLNKIALEFYSFHKFNYKIVESLCKRVRAYDKTLNNVKFCNFQNEVRDVPGDEISHLIYLQSNPESKILYCYIELFNLICCAVVLDENYQGETISVFYHQDALTGERFQSPISLKMPISTILTYKPEDDGFQHLNNFLTSRIRSRDFTKIFQDELNNIMTELKSRLEKGELTEGEFDQVYIDEAAKMFAELTVYHFPYIIEDQDDEENDDYNYVQSNFRKEIVDDFIQEHKELVGKKLKTKDGIWTIDSFHKQSTIVKINKELITLYCKLVEEQSGEVKYIKVKTIINLIVQAIEAMNMEE
jgi:hypothetical protein